MSDDVCLETYLNTNMRTYYLMAQYQKVAKSPPKGIVVIPDPKNISTWYGVLSIHTGYFMNCIFRFTLLFPNKYLMCFLKYIVLWKKE